MKGYDYKGIIQAISDATPSNLVLVSFLVLPVILDYWIKLLSSIFTPFDTSSKILSLVVLVIIYALCIIWLAVENSNRKALEMKKDQILSRMLTNNWSKIGYDSAKKAVSLDITDGDISFQKNRTGTTLKKTQRWFPPISPQLLLGSWISVISWCHFVSHLFDTITPMERPPVNNTHFSFAIASPTSWASFMISSRASPGPMIPIIVRGMKAI